MVQHALTGGGPIAERKAKLEAEVKPVDEVVEEVPPEEV
jgi:hypothetical protein